MRRLPRHHPPVLPFADDDKAKAEYARFVADLKQAAKLAAAA
jgi:hypothetical protein